MKTTVRILSFVLALMLLMPASALITNAASADFSSSIAEGDVLSGESEVSFFMRGDDVPTVLLDGQQLEVSKANEFLMYYTASQVDYGNSEFRVGNDTVGLIKANGSAAITLNASYLDGDRLTVDFLPSAGTSILDTNKIYGEYNIDDMTVSDIYLMSPDGTKLFPSEMTARYPIVGSAGTTEKKSAYKGGAIALGDGWSAETGMGGTTPDKPICFSVTFDLSGEGFEILRGTYRTVISTDKYGDGEHGLVFKNQSGERKIAVTFDNTPPLITTSPSESGVYLASTRFDITVSDENLGKTDIQIDGKKYKSGEELTAYNDGCWHTLTVVATDTCNNTQTIVREFKLADGGEYQYVKAEKGSSITAESGSIYKVAALEAQIDKNILKVDVSESKSVIINLSASADENADITYSLIKNDGSKVTLAVIPSGITRAVQIDGIADEYISYKDGEKTGYITIEAKKMRYCRSDSNTMVWLTDTQYYTRFDDLLCKYEAAIDYYADLFGKGEAGFLLHTGDVADEYSPTENLKAQLEAASRLHKKLDDAKIPYGIVNGNHDVGQSLHDSSYFSQYFGSSRFAGNAWYGGNLNNNESHYDLITLGEYDYILLWLGYGAEDSEITVAWANDVLKRYPNRNAIILTHAYLDSDGSWLLNKEDPMAYTHSRAPEIWNNIVVPNSNVVAVFCGHTNGATRSKRAVDENRYVWEVLSDYQFVEDGTEPKHVLNGMNCDGEGYLRLVTFTGTKMIQKTYSPYSGKENPFGADADSFTVPLVLKKSVSDSEISISAECFEILSETALNGENTGLCGEYFIKSPAFDLTYGSGGFETDNHTSVIIYIALAVAVATAVTVIIILKVRKKQK